MCSACNSFFRLCAVILWTAALLSAQNPSGYRLSGVVKDTSGAQIPGAKLRIAGPDFSREAVTTFSGDFTGENLPDGEVTLQVLAPGFAIYNQKVDIRSNPHVEIVLQPAGLIEQVVVTPTGTETPLNETAESITVIDQAAISKTAALAVDDALRQVPGFTLFRRSNSLTANPTSQGVSLRGVGASGASRALVLEDGVPLNDPFGGWVYWDRIPRRAIDRVEVLRGGASHLYGSDALGGVINIATQHPPRSLVSVETSIGTEYTPDGSLFADYVFGPWTTSIAVEALHSDGYISVTPSARGSVDTAVASQFAAEQWGLSRKFGESAEISASASGYKDSRKNGTPLQRNRTALDSFSLQGQIRGELGEFHVTGYGGGESYHQSFSSIAANRNSESLARLQAVPSQELGIKLQWWRAFGKVHLVAAGADVQQLRGLSDEIVYSGGKPTTHTFSGGRQRIDGFFAQDSLHLPHAWIVSLSGRVDQWENYDASSRSYPVVAGPGKTVLTPFADRNELAFSPRVSLLKTLSQHLSVSASAYRAFRAPTLNELYRAFRLGNVLTLANDRLNAENLTGVEGGATLTFNKLRVRANIFRMDVVHPVSNVTISSTPTLITRQRQNLGRTSSSGLDLESEFNFTNHLALRAGYMFTNATVADFPANRQLQGLQIPQVARHQFTSQIYYAHPAWSVGVQGRASSRQYDDDLNQLPLNGFFSSDAKFTWNFNRRLALFASVEGTGQRYDVARTPVLTIGPPTLFHLGLDFKSVAAK